MAEAKPNAEQAVDLSDDDVQVARHLLSTERSALRVTFFFYLAVAVLIFACPAGLLIVWFERALGIGLLITSAVVFVAVLVVIIRRRALLVDFLTLVRSNRDSESGQDSAASVKPSQTGVGIILLGCGFILVALLVLFGVGWFLYALITTRVVNLPSLIIIAVSVIAFYLLGYYQIRQDFLQYRRVERLRRQIESQQAGETSVPSEEVEFLAQLESDQMIRKVRQAAPEMREQLAKSYAIRTAPEARDYIRRLSTERGEAALVIRRTIDALESNPRPPGAQQVPGSADLLTIRTEGSVIVYRVNDATRNISIVDIRSLDEEVEDAS